MHRHQGIEKQIADSLLSFPGRQGCRAAAGAEQASEPRRRIVVTGLGVVSCYGMDVNHFYDQLLDGKSGVTHIENFDASAYPTVRALGLLPM